MWLQYLTPLVAAAVVVSTAAYAQTPIVEKSGIEAVRARALPPMQVEAIRVIGHNVLSAKKSSIDDPNDAEQLAQLRAAVDRLIAVDLDPSNRMPITVMGEGTQEQRAARLRITKRRETAQADARALAGQLRGRRGILASRAQSNPQADITSAGFPVGEQRAWLFKGWVQKLDAVLDNDTPDRAAKLRELHSQLQATMGGLTDTPLSHGTPTLQAMPSGFVPPKNTDHAAKE